MELTGDLVAIQGILISIKKNKGEFANINHRGGNEDCILDIMVQMEKLLSSKHYIKNCTVNDAFDKEIQDIVMFLTINTNFKNTLVLEGYSHLTNIVPQLSKCMLSNILYGLDLCKSLCEIMKKLPIEISIEILDEMVICLKNSDPKIHLNYAYMFLLTSSEILSSLEINKKNNEHVEKLNEVTKIMLHNLTGLFSDQTKAWKKAKVYEHMGYSLLKFFDLLLNSKKDLNYQVQYTENLLKACCSVMECVTIHVYCTWAEIEEDEESLQNMISTKAYLIVEEFQKYTPAKQLISMLSTIAKKPMTLAEQIHMADVNTMIRKINKNDADQKAWFVALLNTQILKDKASIECAKTWSHLASPDDVTRLLNLSIHSEDVSGKELTIKCASVLSTKELIFVTTRHFYLHGFAHPLNENIHQQMLLLFNKLGDNSKLGEELTKDIVLILLQNPKTVFRFIYNECIKNSYYTASLKDCFIAIKEISEIEKVGLNIFNDIFEQLKPNSQTVNNYVTLLNTLIDINYFSNETVLMKIMFYHLKKEHDQQAFEAVNNILQVLNALNLKFYVKESTMDVILLLLNIMSTSRCKFLEFNHLKQDNARYVVEIIRNKCEVYLNTEFTVKLADCEDTFVTYYENLLSNGKDCSILKHVYEQFNIEKYAECVTKFIQILPICVTSEWLSIAKEIHHKCGYSKTIELFTDVLLLLCQVVQSQEGANENMLVPLYSALKYCIQHFGLVIQQIMQIQPEVDVEVCVANHVCRVLKKFPEKCKVEDGLTIINLLTERSLKSLANNREFVCSLVAVNNTQICQTLSQKMIS